MRSRNREVNIFNMSLLDILTGMLGAFLFLMLGLVPYYTRAQNGKGNDNGDQTPPVDTILNIIAQWKTPAKVDFYILSSDDNIWHSYNEKSLPLSKMTKIANNSCGGGTGWQAVNCYASGGQKYLLACCLQPGADPSTLHNGTLGIQLIEAKSDPKGTGLAGYYLNSATSTFDLSGAKPGIIYALHWIEVTKNENKKEYYEQFDYDWYPPAKHPMPKGVLPLPDAAPILVTPVPVITPPPSPLITPHPTSNSPAAPASSNFPGTGPKPMAVPSK